MKDLSHQPDNGLEVPGPSELPARAQESSGRDGKAEAEAAGFANKNLAEIANTKEHGRREQFRDHLAKGCLALLWLAIGLVGFAIVALGFHALTPEKWAWLSDGQLSKVQTFLFSGAIIGAANGYLRRNLSN